MGLFYPEKRSMQPSAGQLVAAAQMMRLDPAFAPLNTDNAMAHSAVFACVNLYSRLISTLPFHAYRDADGISRRLPNDPPILVTPNVGQPITHWVSSVVQSLVLRGNAFGLVVSRGANNLPTAVQVLHPDLVNARYDWRTDAVEYRIGGVPMDSSKIWHAAINVGPGSPLGMSVLDKAKISVGLGTSSQTYGIQFFQSGGQPNGVLETDAEITADQANSIKDRWNAAVANRRGVAVLGQGFSYKPIGVLPSDTEFLNAYRLSVQDVCRFFAVPPEMVGADAGNSMTYKNLEGRALDLLRFAFDPVIVEVERGLSTFLPRPQYVEANRDSLLRMTTSERYAAHASALGAGWKTVDEVRQTENLPPMADVVPAQAPAEPPTTPAVEPGS
jgi:HK97 family phage portal protein